RPSETVARGRSPSCWSREVKLRFALVWLLDAEDALGFAEGSLRFVVLALLVQRLAFGAQLLHLGHLSVAQVRLGQRGVDGAHLGRTVVREGRGGSKGEDER